MTFKGSTAERCLEVIENYEDQLKAAKHLHPTHFGIPNNFPAVDLNSSDSQFQECDKRIKEGEVIVQAHDRRAALSIQYDLLLAHVIVQSPTSYPNHSGQLAEKRKAEAKSKPQAKKKAKKAKNGAVKEETFDPAEEPSSHFGALMAGNEDLNEELDDVDDDIDGEQLSDDPLDSDENING